MAAAVLEVAARPEHAGVEVRVLPGLTAAQAVASRVGAPLGHDFAVISLSDVLKPLDVVLGLDHVVKLKDLLPSHGWTSQLLWAPASSRRSSR